jgi:hypothetical protein
VIIDGTSTRLLRRAVLRQLLSLRPTNCIRRQRRGFEIVGVAPAHGRDLAGPMGVQQLE